MLTIFFTSTQDQATATLSQAVIDQLIEKAHHPAAKHKGIGAAILPAAEVEDKSEAIVYNSKLRGQSPFHAFVNEQELTDAVVADLKFVGEAPQAKKSKKSK